MTGKCRNTLKKGIQSSLTDGLSSPKAPVSMISGNSLRLCSLWNREKDQVQQKLSDKLGTKVRISHSKKGKGKLVIEFDTLDVLDGILGRIR